MGSPDQKRIEIHDPSPELTMAALATFPFDIDHGWVSFICRHERGLSTNNPGEILSHCLAHDLAPFHQRLQSIRRAGLILFIPTATDIVPSLKDVHDHSHALTTTFDSLVTGSPFLQVTYEFKKADKTENRDAFKAFRKRHLEPMLTPQGYIPNHFILNTRGSDRKNKDICLFLPVSNSKTGLVLQVEGQADKGYSQVALDWIRKLAEEQGKRQKTDEVWI